MQTIEYSHIYANEDFGKEHIESIRELNQLNRLKSKKIIMIDDYTPTEGFVGFDYIGFMNKLRKYNAVPDVIVRESSLNLFCNRVLESLPEGHLKKGLESYISKKDKYPCSLFIAAWYLLRLGVLSGQIETVLGKEKDIYSEEIVTILPERYREAEENGFEIIKATGNEKLLGQIQHIYF